MIRHCETDWNSENRYIGNEDIPLNDNGRNHAKLLSEQFKSKNIKKIYSSNLKRVYETAEIISKFHSLKVEKIPELNEINFGDWVGLTFSEIEIGYKEEANGYLSDPLNFCFPNGETLREFNKRVLDALDLILKKHSNGTILIVAHGGTNRIILGKALNLPLNEHWGIKQDLGCINVIDFLNDVFSVSLINGKKYS